MRLRVRLLCFNRFNSRQGFTGQSVEVSVSDTSPELLHTVDLCWACDSDRADDAASTMNSLSITTEVERYERLGSVFLDAAQEDLVERDWTACVDLQQIPVVPVFERPIRVRSS